MSPISPVTNYQIAGVLWHTICTKLCDETKHLQLYYCKNLALRILRRSLAVGNSDGMAMYSGPRPVSNLPETLRFQARGSKERLGKHDLNAWRLISVAWLAFTHKAEMLGESVFDVAWCCQPIEWDTGSTFILGYGWMAWWEQAGRQALIWT